MRENDLRWYILKLKSQNVEKNDRTEMYGTEREETQMERTEQYPGYNHRVQYYETDQMGCVHHSNYIRWFEESRSDYLAYLGMDYDKMEAQV